MNKRLKSISLKNIRTDDYFWNRYLDLVTKEILPFQWEMMNDRVAGAEKSHCIENFRIAAGEQTGEFYGAVFQDTDVYKWLEAVAFSLESMPDEALEKLADGVVSLICGAQEEDGYLNTYFTVKEPTLKWTNLMEGHELYSAGHMIEAAVAYYKATGKTQFLNTAERAAELICRVFGKDKQGCPGHQEIELALYKLYEVTDNRKYLEMSLSFIDRRGRKPNYFLEEEKRENYRRIFPEFADYDPKYSQSHMPVREQTTAEGHAVRAVYMYCAMADLACEYGDEELFLVCRRLWEDVVNRQMYITGSIGSSGRLERFTTDFDLPNNTNYSETCASIGLALWGRRMAQITRDACYMDTVERALYNTVPAGIALDGKSFFYVNPLEVWPENCIPGTSKEHVKPFRQKWFGVACCPPNIARTLASLGEYICFTSEEGVWINLYTGGEIRLTRDEREIRIKTMTRYPYDGRVHITVRGDDSAAFRLALRIPDYIEQYRIVKDGKTVENHLLEKGYEFLNIKGDSTIEINFDLTPHFVHANPKVREDEGKVALVKGPIIYCLEETDNGNNLPGIFVCTDQQPEEISESEMPGGSIPGGIIPLRLKCRKISEKGWKKGELYKQTRVEWEEIEGKAVPYAVWGNRKTGEMLVWMKEYYNSSCSG